MVKKKTGTHLLRPWIQLKKKPFKVDNVNLLVCNLPCIIYNKRFANNAQNSPSQASAIREP